jgi:PAS domain S-box-containing protein
MRKKGKVPWSIVPPVPFRLLDTNSIMSTMSNQTRFDHRVSEREVIYAHDLKGNLTFLNRKGEQLLGYSRDEACRLNIAQVVAPEIAPHVRDEIAKSMTKQIGTVYQIEVIAKDGRRVPLEVSMRILFRPGQSAQIEGIAVPLRDEQISSTPSWLDADSLCTA